MRKKVVFFLFSLIFKRQKITRVKLFNLMQIHKVRCMKIMVREYKLLVYKVQSHLFLHSLVGVLKVWFKMLLFQGWNKLSVRELLIYSKLQLKLLAISKLHPEFSIEIWRLCFRVELHLKKDFNKMKIKMKRKIKK